MILSEQFALVFHTEIKSISIFSQERIKNGKMAP